MFLNYKRGHVLAVALTLFSVQSRSYAIDSISGEFATGNKTQMIRIGAQWDWKKNCFQSNGTHLGGYWDLTAANWRGTPVFRFQNDSQLGFYAEAGVGAHRLSDLYDNNGRRLSTLFQFGDHIGIGYIFNKKLDIGLKIQHFSNGGYKKPNNGANFAVAKVGYLF